MIVGVQVPGASATLLADILELVVDLNERWYRRTRGPSIDRTGVLYVPDRPADEIVIVAAESIGASVSCGSAAAAWAGHQRAQGGRSRVRLSSVRPGLWHAVAESIPYPGAAWVTWDPAVSLQRRQRA